jgi:hypothetical protein
VDYVRRVATLENYGKYGPGDIKLNGASAFNSVFPIAAKLYWISRQNENRYME